MWRGENEQKQSREQKAHIKVLTFLLMRRKCTLN